MTPLMTSDVDDFQRTLDSPEEVIPELRTIDGFIRFQRMNADERIAVCEQKNSDYADAENREGDGDDFRVFANFLAVEQFGICTAETGLLVRLTDKFMRTINLVRKMQEGRERGVVDESLRDTILDAQNYYDLLLGYLTLKEIHPLYDRTQRMTDIVQRMSDAFVDDEGDICVGDVKVQHDEHGVVIKHMAPEEAARKQRRAEAEATVLREKYAREQEGVEKARRAAGGSKNPEADSMTLSEAGDRVFQCGRLRFVRFHDDTETVYFQTIYFPPEEGKKVMRWYTLDSWTTEYFDALTRDQMKFASVIGCIAEEIPHIEIVGVPTLSRAARLVRRPMCTVKDNPPEPYHAGPPVLMIDEVRDRLELDMWLDTCAAHDVLEQLRERLAKADAITAEEAVVVVHTPQRAAEDEYKEPGFTLTIHPSGEESGDSEEVIEDTGVDT